jgi:hypothetical protein
LRSRFTIVLIAALTAAGVAVNAAAQAPAPQTPETPKTEAITPKHAAKHEPHASHQAQMHAKQGQEPTAQPIAPMEQQGETSGSSAPAK